MAKDTSRAPGDFRWQDDPNYQGPESVKEGKQKSDAKPTATGGGSTLLDVAKATAPRPAASSSATKSSLRGKGSAFLTDTIGKAAGAFDEDAGNQIQSRSAGMRMQNEKPQAQAAVDEYVKAFNDTDDPELKQQFADTAANIAKGANLEVPDAVQAGSTMAGSLAEGSAKLTPMLAMLSLKDGGEVEKSEAEEYQDAFNAKEGRQ